MGRIQADRGSIARLVDTGLPRLGNPNPIVHLTVSSNHMNVEPRILDCNGVSQHVCPTGGRTHNVAPGQGFPPNRHVAAWAHHVSALTPSPYDDVLRGLGSLSVGTANPYATATSAPQGYVAVTQTTAYYPATYPTATAPAIAAAAYPYQTAPAYSTSIRTGGYSRSPNTALPVNTTSGTVRTEARGVFLSNLKRNLNSHDVKVLFRRFGNPVKVERKVDGHKKFNGTAVAHFGSTAEAEYAIQQLNGLVHEGRQLAARFDRETTTIGEVSSSTSGSYAIASSVTQAPGPVIVNGSTA